MLPPLANVDQLEARLTGTIDPADVARAEAALIDASGLVRQEAGGTTWVADDSITAPDAVVAVVIASAKRAFLNPDGYSSESVGEWTGRRRDELAEAYLTEAERAVVRRAVGRAGVGILSTSRWPEPYPPQVYVDTDPPGQPIECDYPWPGQ